MNRFCFILTFLLLIICCQKSVSQIVPPPCMPNYNSITSQFMNIEQSPPLNTGMPYDVMIGYIGFDSLTKSLNSRQLHNYLDTLYWGDTIKYAMKFFYEMVDYDPILFYRYLVSASWPRKLIPSTLTSSFYEKISLVSPHPLLDMVLCASSLIAHIYVNDTMTVIDPSGGWAVHSIIVTSNIIEVIKGTNIPECLNLYPANFERKTKKNDIHSINDSCLQFNYRLELPLDNRTETTRANSHGMRDSSGLPWVKSGKEYIVFLELLMICGDSTSLYLTLRPIYAGSCGTIYPIENNIVYDPNDDYGFGVGKTTDEFIMALRNRINQIKNPNP